MIKWMETLKGIWMQAYSVPSPFTTFVTTGTVLVLLFLAHRSSLLSDVDDRPFYLIGSTSCLHTDNHINQGVIYCLGTCLEPLSHRLPLFTSLHLSLCLLRRSSQR